MKLVLGFLLFVFTAVGQAANVTAYWEHDGLNVEGFWLHFECETSRGAIPSLKTERSQKFSVPDGENCSSYAVAFNEFGDSDPSNVVVFSTPAVEVPGVVRNLRITWAKDQETVIMADFKVQRGTVTIGAGSTTATITAGTNYTAPSSNTKAFIRIVSHHQFTNGDSISDFTGIPGRNSAYVSDPSNILTSITFSRSDANTTNSTAIEWEIIEYIGSVGGANEFVVRLAEQIAYATGEASPFYGTNGITNADPADIVVFITGHGVSGGARGSSSTFVWTSAFNSTTDAAEFTRSATGNAGNISYAVVEFTGSNWSVQRITHSQTAAGAETETITSVGDLSRAFIHIQHRTDTSNGPRQLGYEVYLSSTTQITFDVDVISGTRNFVAWIISNSQTGAGAMSVARYSGIRAANTGSDPDSFTQSITTVADAEQTSIMGECANNGTATTDSHYSMLGFRLTDASTVTMTRGRNANSRDYRFEVVQWPSTVSGGVSLVIQDTTHGQTADSFAVTQDHILAMADAVHSHISDLLGLTQKHNLVLSDAAHNHVSDALVLTQKHNLVISESNHSSASDNLILSQGLNLSVEESNHQTLADNLSVTQSGSLNVSETLHGLTTDNLSLVQSHQLVVADSSHLHFVDNLTNLVEYVIFVNDALHNNLSDQIDLTQNSQIAVSSTLHNHIADSIMIGGGIFQIGSRLLVVAKQDRIYVVDKFDRIASIDSADRIGSN